MHKPGGYNRTLDLTPPRPRGTTTSDDSSAASPSTEERLLYFIPQHIRYKPTFAENPEPTLTKRDTSRTSLNHRTYDATHPNLGAPPPHNVRPPGAASYPSRPTSLPSARTKALSARLPRPSAAPTGRAVTMSNVALNFITYNQDHSCIAVGTFAPSTRARPRSRTPAAIPVPARQSSIPWLTRRPILRRNRHDERIPHISHRSVRQGVQQR